MTGRAIIRQWCGVCQDVTPTWMDGMKERCQRHDPEPEPGVNPYWGEDEDEDG